MQNIKIKSAFLIIILLLVNLLYSQYDEKRIQLNQAQSFENLNQFSRAQQVYTDLLKKNPNDNEVIQHLLSIYFRTSALESINSLLEEKKNILNPQIYTQNKITYLLKNNEIKEAKNLADHYIKDNPQLINNYHLIAMIFENNALFDYAQEYYLTARRISNNENLYAFELANNYFLSQNYKLSIQESVKYLALNKSYIYYISTRIKEIIKNDSLMIYDIKIACEASQIEEIRELYALSLLELKHYDLALNVYIGLSDDKLIKFADDLFASKNLDLALKAYNAYTQKSTNTITNAEIMIKIAQIYLQNKDINSAKKCLETVINLKELSDKRNLYKTRAHLEARVLLANVYILENANKEQVLNLYDEANRYSFNQSDKSNLDFKKINYLIMKEDFLQANVLLNKIIAKEESGSLILAQSYYYQYLVFNMQNDTRADSLMTEYIINFPDNPIINDMMFMSLFLTTIPKDSKNDFFKAYRLKNLFQENEAISLLKNLVEKTKDDELNLLLGEWYVDIQDYNSAKSIYINAFSNPVYNEYAKLAIIRLESEKNKKNEIIKDYLKTSPNSVFSPVFRQLLFNQSIKL